MKNLRKISAMLIIVSIITSLCTFVNAASTEATISEGSKNGNTVTFTITLPTGAVLNGDVKEDGVLDSLDISRLTEYNLKKIKEINELAADYDCQDGVGISDITAINKAITPKWNPVKLIGTLASNSKYEFKKNSNTSYSVIVTVPENTNGTIGVTVKENVFKFAKEVGNKEFSSKEVEVGTKSSTPTTPETTPTPTTNPETTPAPTTADKTIKIADGAQDKNKITFKITLPKDSGFVGDVNNDGKVTEEDVTLLEKYNLRSITSKDINMVNSDVDANGAVELADLTALKKMLLAGIKQVTLTGTLAADSKFELVKGTDGTYSIVVTVPENKEGTIGVSLNKGTIIFADHTTNGAVSSKEFKVTLDSLKGTDAKTDENTSNDNTKQAEDGKDANAKYSKLPAAGSVAIGGTIALVAVAAVFGFVKYKRIDK